MKNLKITNKINGSLPQWITHPICIRMYCCAGIFWRFALVPWEDPKRKTMENNIYKTQHYSMLNTSILDGGAVCKVVEKILKSRCNTWGDIKPNKHQTRQTTYPNRINAILFRFSPSHLRRIVERSDSGKYSDSPWRRHRIRYDRSQCSCLNKKCIGSLRRKYNKDTLLTTQFPECSIENQELNKFISLTVLSFVQVDRLNNRSILDYLNNWL